MDLLKHWLDDWRWYSFSLLTTIGVIVAVTLFGLKDCERQEAVRVRTVHKAARVEKAKHAEAARVNKLELDHAKLKERLRWCCRTKLEKLNR